MAVSLVSTGITFPDATTQTTAASASGSRSFTASGAIASAGLPVALNANGTVSTVANTAGSAAITLASTTTTDVTRGRAMMFSPTSNVYVAVYKNSSGTSILAIAATLSGTTFTWGTEVQVASNGNFSTSAFDPVNNKFVVVTVTNGSNMDAYVLSVSGTTISVGAVTNIDTSGNVDGNHSITYEAKSGKMVLLYTNTTPFARVGTVSGTTTSWSSATAAFGSVGTNNLYAYAANDGVVFSGSRTTGTVLLQLQAGTVSGTTLTLGSLTSSSEQVSLGSVVFSPATNLYYWTGTNLNASTVVSIQQFRVSGTVVSLVDSMTVTTISMLSGSRYASAYDPGTGRVVVGYSATSTGYGSVFSFLNVS